MNKKEQKIIKVVDIFIRENIQSIKEVSILTNISTSSIQRYLNENDMILKYYNEKTLKKIKQKLIISKQKGNRQGGINNSLTNTLSRDDKGKFTGSIKA